MKVLLPVDGSPASQAAVEALIRQCDPADTEVCVVHIVENSLAVDESLAFADSAAAAQIVADDIEERRRRGYQITSGALERLRAAGFKASTYVHTGDPSREVLAMATQWPADAIMMGSHGRRGLDRLLMGSVAEHVLRHAHCAVSIVRPPLVQLRKAS